MDSPNFSGSASDESSHDSDEKEAENQDAGENEKNESEAHEKQDETNRDDVVNYIKNVTVLFDLQPEDWTPEVLRGIRRFVGHPEETTLYIYFDCLELEASFVFPTDPIEDYMYFLKHGECEVNMDNIFDCLLFGSMNGNTEGSLLNLIQHVYAFNIFRDTSLPETAKDQLFDNMHNTLAQLTDAYYKLNGLTVPYIPPEAPNLTVEDAARDKCLIRRLEGVMTQWSRQLRVAVGDSRDRSAVLLLTVSDEHEFWKQRWESLTLLRNHLVSPAARRISDILTLGQSSLQLQFRTQMEEMDRAIEEAESNASYVQVLVGLNAGIENESNVNGIINHFPKILQFIRSIWLSSPFYNSPDRITTLCQNLSNQVILRCRAAVDVDSIFENYKTRTVISVLESNIECCQKFRMIYEQRTKKFSTASNPWRVEDRRVFGNIEAFEDRNENLIEICQAMITFGRMDEPSVTMPVFSGTSGPQCLQTVRDIEARFADALAKVSDRRNDILNVLDLEWQPHMMEFRKVLRELDVTILGVMSSSMDESTSAEEAIACMQSYIHFAGRPMVAHLLHEQTEKVWKLVLEEVQAMRQKLQLPHPPRHNHCPSYAGPVLLASSQHARLVRLRNSLSGAKWLPVVAASTEGLAQLTSLTVKVDTFIRDKYQAWCSTVGDDIMAKLDRALIKRSTTHPGLVDPNFDHTLTNLANDCQFWDQLDKPPPQPAQEFLAQWPRVRILYEEVLAMCQNYNKIISALTDEERRLFKPLIGKVDKKFESGFYKLNWTIDNFGNFIDGWNRGNNDLADFLADYKIAMSRIVEICERICELELVGIPQNTTFQLSTLEKHIETGRSESFMKLVEMYRDLLKDLAVIYEGFEEVLPETGIHWSKFIKKLDAALQEALIICVTKSMETMQTALSGNSALLHISISLHSRKIVFTPSLAQISSLGHHFLPDVVMEFKVIPRIYDKLRLEGKGPAQFHRVVETNELCNKLQKAINCEVSSNITKIQEYLAVWQPYRWLWESNIEKVLGQYDDLEAADVDWNFEMRRFDTIAAEVMQKDESPAVHFSQLNATPIKTCIATCCQNWKRSLCEILEKKTSATISEISNECRSRMDFLMREPKTLHDLDEALRHHSVVAGSLASVEEKFPKIDVQCKVLQCHGFPAEMLNDSRKELSSLWARFLVTLPDAEKRLEMSKETFKAGLVHQYETLKTRISEMVAYFSEDGPFSCKWTPSDALNYLKKIEDKITELEAEEEKMKVDMEILRFTFQCNVELQTIRAQLKLLLHGWTLVDKWAIEYSNFRETEFRKVNVVTMKRQAEENLKVLTEKLAELSDLGWSITDEACTEIDALIRSLLVVTELSNHAFRPRHWSQISDLSQLELDQHDPQFNLGTIIDMRLYEHVAAVSDISRSASQELAIESGLDKIKDAWQRKKVSLEPFKEMKGIYTLLPTDEIIQTIEEHQTILSAIKSTRFVEPFLKDVEYWERTLTTVDEYLELVLAVQRQWSCMANIFASEEFSREVKEEAGLFRQVTSLWKSTTTKMYENMVVIDLCQQEGLFLTLSEVQEQLEIIQKGLSVFLGNKRLAFPRLYFVSNDALLEILSNSKTPQLVQRHLKNLFGNLYSLVWDRSMHAVAMSSIDGEQIDFKIPVECSDGAEIWLSEIEKAMRTTLRVQLKATRQSLKKCRRDKWIKENPGQLCVLASQIQWTADCTRVLMSCTEDSFKSPLKNLRRKQKEAVSNLSEMLRGELSPVARLKVMALTTIEMHARDVINALYKSKCTSVNSFLWSSQLRFYMDKAKDDCIVRQTFTCFDYGYEYLGNSERLAITALTDRCFMTLTMAMHIHYGGYLKGPADTGKTETVKDLGKALGALVIVINCSEGLNFEAMGHLLAGLAQTGAWGCFDDFNRITPEVLAVVAQQISAILTALSSKALQLTLMGTDMRLVQSCGLFITTTPGLGGRTELSENLLSKFRPISMAVPDKIIIAEVSLCKEGFHEYKGLARKVASLYSLSMELLSKQDHYHFGLREMASAIKYAGITRRSQPSLSDVEVLFYALRETYLPKLTADDLNIFSPICRDLFPGIDPPSVDQSIFRGVIIQQMELEGLQPKTELIDKVIHLYELMCCRHAVIMVGSTCSGKSTTWRILKATLSALSSSIGQCYHSVSEHIINPKTLSVGELFGEMNLSTGEWRDGVASSIMRRVCSEKSEQRKWVIFDGPIDATWIENLSSVMDDNKVLTLSNCERICLPEEVSLLFEVEHLQSASPVTLSRGGVVYVDYEDLTWLPYVQSWLKTIPSDAVRAEIDSRINQLMPGMLKLRASQCKEVVSPHELSLVRNFCQMMDSFCLPDIMDLTKDDLDNPKISVLTNLWLLFCLIWSVGGTLDAMSRQKMDALIRETEDVYPVRGTVYEYYVDVKLCKMAHWENQLDDNWTYDLQLPYHQIVVPTIDTLRYSMLMKTALESGHPVLIAGPMGVGKTAIARTVLQQLPHSKLFSTMSPSTSASAIQLIVEGRLEKRTKGVYGPMDGRQMVVFLDDFNLPDEFGSQPSLEMIRHWIEYGFWYDRANQCKKILRDVIFCGAMGPTVGGGRSIPNRLLSKFAVVTPLLSEEDQLARIFRVILKPHLAIFDDEVKVIVEPLTEMTIELFGHISCTLRPTPLKTHYQFNLRDISRVFQGLLRSHKDTQNTAKKFVGLWTHEVHRVFADRLIDDEDREIVSNKVSELLRCYIDPKLSRFCPKQLPIFGTFLGPHGRYEEMIDRTVLKEYLETELMKYNQKPENSPLNLALFDDAIEHICKIVRAISLPWGHSALIGVKGTGKSSLSRLAVHLCQYSSFPIKIDSKNKPIQFLESLKALYWQTGVEGRPTVLTLTNIQNFNDDFLEIINGMLSTGEVPNLYRREELEDIRASLSTKCGLVPTAETALQILIERVKSNFHFVLTMDLSSPEARAKILNYPALLRSATMDWFQPWPKEALTSVAQHTMKNWNTLDDFSHEIAGVFADMHKLAIENARQMTDTLSRPCYITPSNFLHFMSSYHELLSEKKDSLNARVKMLRGGLSRIEEAKEHIAKMTSDLENAQSRVLVIKEECEVAQTSKELKKKEVDEQAKLVKAESERIAEDEAVCQKLALETQDELSEAVSMLETVLDKLTNTDFSELKSCSRPPPKVLMVMEAVCVLLDVPPEWTEAQHLLSDEAFLTRLKDFDKEQISDRILEKIVLYTSQEDFQPERIESIAAQSLCLWVHAIGKYGKQLRFVGPKKVLLDETIITLKCKKQDLVVLTTELSDLEGTHSAWIEDCLQKTAEKENLETEANRLQVNLKRGAKIVDGLSQEKVRWEARTQELMGFLKNLPGDSLLPSAFLSYAGPFTSSFRKELCEEWAKLIKAKLSISQTENLNMIDFLSDPSIVEKWINLGLPSDQTSVENAIIAVRSTRSVIIVDPFMQANKWVRNLEKELTVVDSNSVNLMEIIEKCAASGTPVLLQNVLEDIDPSLISCSTVLDAGKPFLQIGEKLTPYSEGFRLYVTTKLANPNFPAEIFSKTTLINFETEREGLEAQFLGLVVQHERPDLEDLKARTHQILSNGRKTLLKLDADLLQFLSQSEGSLMENEPLSKTLEDSRSSEARVKESHLAAKRTKLEIEKTRKEYTPIAVRATILFICVKDLSSVHPMYKFSLDAYIQLFQKSLKKSPKSEIVSERVENVVNFHTYAVYRSVSRALFQRHRLMFSFYVCVKIMENEDKDIRENFEMLVRGGPECKVMNQSVNKSAPWLSAECWDNVVKLGAVPSLKGLPESFQAESENWKAWYFSPCPEQSPLFGCWSVLDGLTKLLLIQALSRDRLKFAISNFVAENLGQKFIEPLLVDFMNIYEESSAKCPVLIMTDTADPTSDVFNLAWAKGMSDTLHTISLGQGQVQAAEVTIRNAAKDGFWVHLTNCHLSPSWLGTLAVIVEQIQSNSNVHPKFRLWFSSSLHKDFPVSLLHDCIKVAMERPMGIKEHLQCLYQCLPQDKFHEENSQSANARIFLSVAFFHAVLSERRKFLELGWNGKFNFNLSDFQLCEDIITLYLTDDEEVPWDALRLLLAGICYGGHLSDIWDRRVLMTYAKEFFHRGLLKDPNFRFSQPPVYQLPSEDTLAAVQAFIDRLPVCEPPEVFGLYPNAAIRYQTLESDALCRSLLSMLKPSSQSSLIDSEGQAEALIEELLRLPELLDSKMVGKKSFPLGPVKQLILQEAERYNNLLVVICEVLRDAKNALTGHTQILPVIEELLVCLKNGRVPGAWLKAYPSMKSLSSWVSDLVGRVQFFKDWLCNGRTPLAVWLGAFTRPSAFLTAVQLKTARSIDVPVDHLSWQFEFFETLPSDFPEEGFYVKNLYLEGAGWDLKRSCLVPPTDLQVITEMPFVWFRTASDVKPSNTRLYTCPVYQYPIRHGSFVIAMDLPCGDYPPETYIKLGTALLLTTDS